MLRIEESCEHSTSVVTFFLQLVPITCVFFLLYMWKFSPLNSFELYYRFILLFDLTKCFIDPQSWSGFVFQTTFLHPRCWFTCRVFCFQVGSFYCCLPSKQHWKICTQEWTGSTTYHVFAVPVAFFFKKNEAIYSSSVCPLHSTEFNLHNFSVFTLVFLCVA